MIFYHNELDNIITPKLVVDREDVDAVWLQAVYIDEVVDYQDIRDLTPCLDQEEQQLTSPKVINKLLSSYSDVVKSIIIHLALLLLMVELSIKATIPVVETPKNKPIEAVLWLNSQFKNEHYIDAPEVVNQVKSLQPVESRQYKESPQHKESLQKIKSSQQVENLQASVNTSKLTAKGKQAKPADIISTSNEKKRLAAAKNKKQTAAAMAKSALSNFKNKLNNQMVNSSGEQFFHQQRLAKTSIAKSKNKFIPQGQVTEVAKKIEVHCEGVVNNTIRTLSGFMGGTVTCKKKPSLTEFFQQREAKVR